MGRPKGARNRPKPGAITFVPEPDIPSAAKLAHKALADAIGAETANLQRELEAKDRRIVFLEAQLRGIAAQCASAVDSMISVIADRPANTPPELAAMFAKARERAEPEDNELPPLDDAPPIELSDEDNLGQGRWV